MFKSDGTSRLVAIPRESPILEIAEVNITHAFPRGLDDIFLGGELRVF